MILSLKRKTRKIAIFTDIFYHQISTMKFYRQNSKNGEIRHDFGRTLCNPSGTEKREIRSKIGQKKRDAMRNIFQKCLEAFSRKNSPKSKRRCGRNSRTWSKMESEAVQKRFSRKWWQILHTKCKSVQNRQISRNSNGAVEECGSHPDRSRAKTSGIRCEASKKDRPTIRKKSKTVGA